MVHAVALVAVILLPTAIGGAVLAMGRLVGWLGARRAGPAPIGPPIQRIAADVRRLRRQRDAMLLGPPRPGRGVRTRALESAYADALGAACRALEVPPPRMDAAGRQAAEVSRVESELRARGLDVGQAAS